MLLLELIKEKETIMKTICEKAYAKINLTLDVTGKRDDGYHELEMIMQQIDLYDEIILKRAESGISIASDNDKIPLDENNLAYKAAERFFEHVGIESGVEIFIRKKIPMEAGLAGGSSDAAAVLKGLNKMYSKQNNKNHFNDINVGLLSEVELRDIGLSLGADVPFCIMGGTALSKGIGEILTPINCPSKIYYVLAKPKFGVSTKQAFSIFDLNYAQKNRQLNQNKTMDAISFIKTGDVINLSSCMFNALEESVVRIHPDIEKIKRLMIENGALNAIMTGSGSTVFGLCADFKNAQKIAVPMQEICEFVKVVSSI